MIAEILQSENRLFDDVRELLQKEPEENTRLGNLKRVSELVSTFYGAILVVVGTTMPDEQIA